MKSPLFLLSIILCLCSLYGCKKSTTTPKNTNETLQIIVTGARIDYSYSLSCTDITKWTNPSSPEPAAFWSTDNQTTDQTFTVDVYAGEEIDFEDLGTPLVNQKKGNPTKVTSTPEKPPGVLHNVAKGKTGDGKVLEKPELDEEEGTPLVNQKSGNPTKVTGTANVIKGVIKGGGKGDQDLFQKN